ncbi:hypothetical protein AAG906_011437 [Vitis piasezkii]
MIMSWLWDSINPAISNTCMFLTTAKEIWDSIHRTYSKARDAAQVYEIKCSEDTAILKNFIEKDQVYDFLVGLNPEFDQEKGGLNSEGIERLRGLLGSLEKPSGACSSALSGATDHMTHTSQYFNSHTPCPSSRKIIVANGSLATVAGLGDIYVTPLILKNVLHIGLAKERNGLYYLETSGSSNKVMNNLDVPKSYWEEVVLTSTYMINRLPSQILDFKIPWKPLQNSIHIVFGCTSLVHVHSQNRGKLDPKAIKYVFLGYSSTQKGISVIILPLENFTYLSMPPLLKANHTSLMKDKDCGDLDSFRPLDLASIPSPSTQKQNVPTFIESISVPEFVPAPEHVSTLVVTPTSVRIYDSMLFPQVHSRKTAIPDLTQVQNDVPSPANEDMVSSNPSLHIQSVETPTRDLDLPIALRKGTREYTKRPL